MMLMLPPTLPPGNAVHEGRRALEQFDALNVAARSAAVGRNESI